MKQAAIRRYGMAMLVAGLALAVPVYAAKHGGPGMMDGKGGGMGGPGMMQMSGVMHDMADQMIGMAGTMGQGKLSEAQQKQMADRMRTMATMIDNMSGMMGKGMMMDATQQKQMDQMRKQMDDMMKSPPGTSKK